MDELFSEILTRNVDEGFDKSEYEGMPSVSAEQPIAAQGSEPSEFVGMPSADPGKTEQFSEDDVAVEEQVTDGAGGEKKLAQGSTGSGDGGGLGQSHFADGGFQIAKGDFVHYSDASDRAIEKAMQASPDGVNLSAGPSFRICGSGLQYPRTCVNEMCKSAFSRVLTVCPTCDTDQFGKSGQIYGPHVEMDDRVVKSLIPENPDADIVIG